jgi:hypothetical protein
MYKKLIKRKVASLVQASDPHAINSPATPKSYQRFDENKQKEVIVWIRQLPGLDKLQITDEIKQKFNISDEDAERLYYEAYPDGMSSQEEELTEYFEQALPENEPQIVDEAFAIVVENKPITVLDSFNIDPEISELFLNFVKALTDTRKL